MEHAGKQEMCMPSSFTYSIHSAQWAQTSGGPTRHRSSVKLKGEYVMCIPEYVRALTPTRSHFLFKSQLASNRKNVVVLHETQYKQVTKKYTHNLSYSHHNSPVFANCLG